MCSHWDELRVEQNRPVSQLPLRECCGGTHVERSLCDRSLLAGLANPARTLGGALHVGWVSRSGTNQAIKGQTAQYHASAKLLARNWPRPKLHPDMIILVRGRLSWRPLSFLFLDRRLNRRHHDPIEEWSTNPLPRLNQAPPRHQTFQSP